jgi:hypothetical protein
MANLRGGTIVTTLSSKLCVDASAWTNGANVLTWPCHGRNNQFWELLADGSVRARGTNKCLDVRGAGTAQGTLIQVWDCASVNQQRWFLDGQKRLHPYHAPNMCLDVSGANTNSGIQLQLWPCSNGNNAAQQYDSLLPVFAPNNNRIASRLNSFCLDVYGFDSSNGAPVVMWPCHTASNQLWTLNPFTGLVSPRFNQKKCLDASCNDLGCTVYSHDCHGGASQQWFQDALGRLRPYSAPNRCLDVRGANPDSGTAVQLWECLDVPQQKWFVI